MSGTVTSPAAGPRRGERRGFGGGPAPVTTQTLTAGRSVRTTLRTGHAGVYILTFSLAGYESETVGVTLGSSGSVSSLNVTLPLFRGRSAAWSGAAAGRSPGLPCRSPTERLRCAPRCRPRFPLAAIRSPAWRPDTGRSPSLSPVTPAPDRSGRPPTWTSGEPAGNPRGFELTVRVEVSPRRLSAVPGQPATVIISLANTATVITGHRIRVLGVDPRWVELDTDELSLFPDTTGVAKPRDHPPPRRSRRAAHPVDRDRRADLSFRGDGRPVELIVPAEHGLKRCSTR